MGVAVGFQEVLAKQLTELQRRLTQEFQSTVQKLEADNLALRSENEVLRAQLSAPAPPGALSHLPRAPSPRPPPGTPAQLPNEPSPGAPDTGVAPRERALGRSTLGLERLKPGWEEAELGRATMSHTLSLRGAADQGEASAWPIWRRMNEESCGGGAGAKPRKQGSVSTHASDCSMIVVTTRSGWAAGTLHPNSLLVLAWTFIGILLLSYDAVLIPMTSGFDLGHLAFLRALDVVVVCYWTADLVRAFFTGYEDGSELGVEMRRPKIAAHYCKTWLALDLGMVCVDVVLTFAPVESWEGGPTRAGRTARVWRMIRVLRILRVLKMARRLWRSTERTVSIQFVLAVKAIYVFVVDLFVCHYMACGLCALGRWKADAESWETVKRMDTAPVHEVYAAALNWALAQSGFSTSDIQAVNALENLYTSLCGFLWMVVVSVTIGLFYTWMREGREAGKGRVQEGKNLRKYLEQRGVSRRLASQILRYFRFNYQPYEPKVMEAEINFLRQMPSSFQIKLRKEVYMTSLRQHPFFSTLGTENEPALVAICQLAITEYRFRMGETAFKHNVEARGILLVTSGELDYHPQTAGHDSIRVQTGSWLCEAALWRRWRHRGRLIAATSCELLGVDAQKVHAILEDRADEDGWESLSMVRKHARKALSFYRAFSGEPSPRLDTDNLMKAVPRASLSPRNTSSPANSSSLPFGAVHSNPPPFGPANSTNLMVWEDQSTHALVKQTIAEITSMKPAPLRSMKSSLSLL